jgi:hypothetical protein
MRLGIAQLNEDRIDTNLNVINQRVFPALFFNLFLFRLIFSEFFVAIPLDESDCEHDPQTVGPNFCWEQLHWQICQEFLSRHLGSFLTSEKNGFLMI